MSVNRFSTNKSDHAQQHMWAAVVLITINDAFTAMRDRTELDRAEALRFARASWGTGKVGNMSAHVQVQNPTVCTHGRSKSWPERWYSAHKGSAGIARPLGRHERAARKPQPTEEARITPAPDAGQSPPSIVDTFGVLRRARRHHTGLPRTPPADGTVPAPRENSQQGRVLKALTMQRGGTLNSLRKAYAKWEQVAVELCRRLDLELIYRHDGHEVDGIVDANTKGLRQTAAPFTRCMISSATA
ncbi:MAG: hypothetical protein IPF96_19970 [Rhodobacter sp.]|nr:hypothetical protein [Rhodobacter sp.]